MGEEEEPGGGVGEQYSSLDLEPRRSSTSSTSTLCASLVTSSVFAPSVEVSGLSECLPRSSEEAVYSTRLKQMQTPLIFLCRLKEEKELITENML